MFSINGAGAMSRALALALPVLWGVVSSSGSGVAPVADTGHIPHCYTHSTRLAIRHPSCLSPSLVQPTLHSSQMDSQLSTIKLLFYKWLILNLDNNLIAMCNAKLYWNAMAMLCLCLCLCCSQWPVWYQCGWSPWSQSLTGLSSHEPGWE